MSKMNLPEGDGPMGNFHEAGVLDLACEGEDLRPLGFFSVP